MRHKEVPELFRVAQVGIGLGPIGLGRPVPGQDSDLPPAIQLLPFGQICPLSAKAQWMSPWTTETDFLGSNPSFSLHLSAS